MQYKYNKQNKELTIIFVGHRAYTYRGVDEDTANGLGTAGSAGSYVHQHIKGKYPFRHGMGDDSDNQGEEFRGRGGQFRGGRGATGSW